MENETGVVDSPQQTESVENVSTDDLRNLLSQSAESENPLDGLQNQPVSAADIESQDQAVPENDIQSAESEIPEGVDDERLAKRRIRPKSDQDQQVIDLYRSEGFQGTFADASSIIYGQPQAAQAPQQAAEAPPPRNYVKEVKDYVGHVQSEIDELNSKVLEAAENMDTAEAIKLQQQITNKQLQIQKVETKRDMYVQRSRSAQEQSRRARSTESRNVAVSEFPELANDTSMYRKEFDHFVDLAQSDPDYAPIFQSSRWPELMAREFGTMKGQLPAQAQPVVQEAQQSSPPPNTQQARMLTSGATSQPINPSSRGVGDITQLSTQDLYNLLGQPDGTRHLR